MSVSVCLCNISNCGTMLWNLTLLIVSKICWHIAIIFKVDLYSNGHYVRTYSARTDRRSVTFCWRKKINSKQTCRGTWNTCFVAYIVVKVLMFSSWQKVFLCCVISEQENGRCLFIRPAIVNVMLCFVRERLKLDSRIVTEQVASAVRHLPYIPEVTVLCSNRGIRTTQIEVFASPFSWVSK
jgi:hypothetical protein